MTTSEAVLVSIDTFIRDKGFSPTVREVGIATGLQSTATVHGHLHRLSEKKLISFIEFKPRTITITTKGKELLEQLNSNN